jgi:hypothetical protein
VSFNSTSLINLKSDFVSEQVVVEDVSLLFGIDLTGDKVIMDQIISEELSYEEKELKKYRNLKTWVYPLKQHICTDKGKLFSNTKGERQRF